MWQPGLSGYFSFSSIVSAKKQWTPNGRPTPGHPRQTIPEAPDRRSDDRSKGLSATDLLPTYGKRNQCVVFVLRPSLRLCQFAAQQPPRVLSLLKCIGKLSKSHPRVQTCVSIYCRVPGLPTCGVRPTDAKTQRRIYQESERWSWLSDGQHGAVFQE